MKSNILQQLMEMMMGETGSKVKPKIVSVEMVVPKKDAGGLEEVLDKAQEDEPAEEMGEPIDADGDGDHDMDDHEMAEDCDDEEEEKPRMSLKDFLARK